MADAHWPTAPETRALLDGVTPSASPNRWRVERRYSFIAHMETWQVVWDVPNSLALSLVADTGGKNASDKANARFIAARDLVPALAAEIARLTAERDAALIRAERSERCEVAAHDAANTAIKQRDEARAQVAMAYEAAAHWIEAVPQSLPNRQEYAWHIRALTPADATAALAARDAAMRNEGRRQAAAACDWGDIYGDNAVSAILAALEPEGWE